MITQKIFSVNKFLAMGFLVLALGVVSVIPAQAHVDPVGCSAVGGSISVTVLRVDGITPIGAGAVVDGESINYRATLSWPGLPVCAYQGGTWTLTTPDGAVNNITPGGGIPEIGGAGVASLNSILIPYIVNHANEIGFNVVASTNYGGGIAHRFADDTNVHPGPTLSTSDVTPVIHTPVVTTEIHDVSHAVITSALVGADVHDKAIVTGIGTSTPMGTVDFNIYNNTTCSENPVSTESGVALSGGAGESSSSTVPSTGMSYKAHYNGQTNVYTPADGDCEPLAVPKGHIVIDKVTNPSGDSSSFAFTTTGSGYSGFYLTDVATPNDQELAPGIYSVAETPVVGWDETDAVCMDGVNLVSPAVINLQADHTVYCTFTNTKRGSITVVKDAQPNDLIDFAFSGNFDSFSLDDDAGVVGEDNVLSNTKTLINKVPGVYTITETEPNSFWYLSGATCVENGTANVYPSTLNGTALMLTLNPGADVTCTFVNKKLGGATRTQGFWQTHTGFTSDVFAANFGGGMQIGSGTHKGLITNLPGAGQSQLFGAYYSNVSKTSTGAKRTAVDQARMQLLQQLVTAKLNCAEFGCDASIQTLVANADAAYAAGNKSDILAFAGQLDAFNNSGDTIIIGSAGSATPSVSQSRANKAFWNTP